MLKALILANLNLLVLEEFLIYNHKGLVFGFFYAYVGIIYSNAVIKALELFVCKMILLELSLSLNPIWLLFNLDE